MARPRKSAEVDYSTPHDLTHGLLERAACPADLPFVLVRDADKKGLRLRVTKAGGKHWQFETRIKGKLFTRTLGEWPTVPIDQAKAEAHRLRGLTEQGIDPRDLERQQQAEKIAREAANEAKQVAQAITVQDAWTAYLAERRQHWGDRHYADHVKMADGGGRPAKRGTNGRKVTIAGPIHPLLSKRLVDLSPATIEAWAATEAKTRPTYGRLAWRCLKAFLTWCDEQEAYKDTLQSNPAKSKKAREAFGKPTVKHDVLEKGQVPAWFDAVRGLDDAVTSAYLQVLLLIGARPGEVLALKWSDIELKWKSITIRDKVEGERLVPLTPYVHSLIAVLPRRNEWVFSSTTAADGRLTIPRNSHVRACKVAGIDGLSLHGLRRSFKSLTEWLEIPAGVVAQLMGHKPSATAEKHYTVRPLDLLRVHHEKIEAWILEQAEDRV